MKRSRWSFAQWGAVSVLMVTSLFGTVAGAQSTYEVLYSFTGKSDGGGPSGPVVLDHEGNLYGTAVQGGTLAGRCVNFGGCGVVFELSPSQDGSWTEKVLYNFTGNGNGKSDGLDPASGVIFDTEGNLYGTTYSGGIVNCGTVFKLIPGSDAWTEQQLHLFCTGNDDGSQPKGSLVLDKANNLFGTTWVGGRGDGGVVYELTAGAPSYDLPYEFCGTICPGGRTPLAGVVLDAAGNLYGTTTQAGTTDDGVVFELTPGSGGTWQENVLYTFGSYAGDGINPWRMIFAGPNHLVVTTAGGGSNECGEGGGGCGTVVVLTRGANGDWKEKVIHSFASGVGGYFPNDGVIVDKAGNLYGTTLLGGIVTDYCPYGCGTVYKLSPGANGEWKYTVLHTFAGPTGTTSYGGLAMDKAENLYGTALLNGPDGYGVVFEIKP